MFVCGWGGGGGGGGEVSTSKEKDYVIQFACLTIVPSVPIISSYKIQEDTRILFTNSGPNKGIQR